MPLRLPAIFFARRLRQLLNAIANAANDVAAGNWSRQVPVNGPAELRATATAFNAMVLALSRRDREARIDVELLQATIERYRAILDAAADAIISVDGGGRIRFWNRRAQALFGYAEHEALGQSLTMLVPERYVRANEDGIEQYLMRDDPQPRTLELHGLTRDGLEIPLELSLSSARFNGAAFYTAVFRDISPRLQTEGARTPVAREHRGAQVT